MFPLEEGFWGNVVPQSFNPKPGPKAPTSSIAFSAIPFATTPEFSGGSAGVMGCAEAVRVFGEGAIVANLHSSQEVRNAASLKGYFVLMDLKCRADVQQRNDSGARSRTV